MTLLGQIEVQRKPIYQNIKLKNMKILNKNEMMSKDKLEKYEEVSDDVQGVSLGLAMEVPAQ